MAAGGVSGATRTKPAMYLKSVVTSESGGII